MNQDENLKSLCMQTPPDFEEIEHYIIDHGSTPDSLGQTLCKIILECADEHKIIYGLDPFNTTNPVIDEVGNVEYLVQTHELTDEEKRNIHSSYIYELTKLFLKYGLVPNAIYDEYENVMDLLQFIGYEYVAADTLGLLLEHGGDPFLEIAGAVLFDELVFDVEFGALEMFDKKLYDAHVHYWMVMVGFGAQLDDGDQVEMYSDYSFEMLKDHKNYDYYIERTHPITLHLFDRRTKWEVAVW